MRTASISSVVRSSGVRRATSAMSWLDGVDGAGASSSGIGGITGCIGGISGNSSRGASAVRRPSSASIRRRRSPKVSSGSSVCPFAVSSWRYPSTVPSTAPTRISSTRTVRTSVAITEHCSRSHAAAAGSSTSSACVSAGGIVAGSASTGFGGIASSVSCLVRGSRGMSFSLRVMSDPMVAAGTVYRRMGAVKPACA